MRGLGANPVIYLLLRLVICSRVHQHHDEVRSIETIYDTWITVNSVHV